MKKKITAMLALMLVFVSIFALTSCFNTVDAEGLWENATYRRDMTFGNGSKTINVSVEAGEDSVVFTVKTDKTTLADALTEHGIIAGEITEFGLSVYTVNGMTANFNTENVYWALYEGEAYANGGASDIEIADGDSYRFVYSAF